MALYKSRIIIMVK